mmetsp:Transcript_9426/g.836  ORF Transcript_9426/g.836 Transcript_9426/m.836 type:complete len:91 (-) Transcript_9426:150-422(-)
MRYFDMENLNNIEMPKKLREILFVFVDEARKTAREIIDGKIIKTDLYSHSHYKLLFLKLDTETIKLMSLREKDYILHKKVLDIDFRGEIK